MTCRNPTGLVVGGMPGSLRGSLGRLWQRWRFVAERIADVQARAIFTILYFVLLAPFALGVKFRSDPLRLKPGADTGWRALPRQTATLDEARRQF